mgnify:CR=1 FL=1
MAAGDYERILVLAPTGRDAALSCEVLARAGLSAVACPDVTRLCAAIREGVGAVMLAHEVLVAAAMQQLTEVLREQEPWSDLPLLIFTGAVASPSARPLDTTRLLPLGNVQLLDRPVRVATLISAAHAALRARRRQYSARDLLLNQAHAVHQRDQFLAMLGHELRNPLAAILMATQMMDGGTPAQIERARAIIERQGRHLGRLVDDLLDVARVTSGKIVLRRRPLDLSELVARSLQGFDARIRSQGLTLELRCAAAPLFIDGDSDRIEQVVSNLINNAIKYTPAGGQIWVQLEREGAQAVLRVRDSGVGIEPRMLGRVFELFAQADSTIDRAQGGMGIGLTMVRRLVQLHDGEVEVTSPGRGQGSEFVVTLPLLPEAPAPEPAPDPPLPEPAPGGGCHVLIVEDSVDNRAMLQSLLEGAGHRVSVAADGLAGVERAVQLRPDAVIVDIGLPGIDGYEVARRIRSACGPDMLLLAVTGYGQPDDRRRALEAGFADHLTKPVDLARLGRLLASAAALRSQA